MKRILYLFLLISALVAAQNEPPAQAAGTLKGRILNAQTEFPMESVHIVNLTLVRGAITDPDGFFEIPAQANDTLYITFLGFKPEKVRVTNDMMQYEGTVIKLNELAFALEEVVVRPYMLTGYLDIDVKNLPINSSYQYSISGLNQSYEAGNRAPGAVTKVLGAILNPADMLRNLFGKRPRQMRKLQKMKEDDEIRNLLASKFDRNTLGVLLQLEKVDIEDILSNCNYSKSFIMTANDLQILDAISNCYEEYKVLNRN